MKNEKALCLNFCKYYKPGKNEEFECRGAVIVRHLMQQGRRIPLERPADMSAPSSGAAAALRKAMCGDCEFFIDGCDFILTGGEAVPCGGFILLARLLDEGAVEIDDLKRDSPL